MVGYELIDGDFDGIQTAATAALNDVDAAGQVVEAHAVSTASHGLAVEVIDGDGTAIGYLPAAHLKHRGIVEHLLDDGGRRDLDSLALGDREVVVTVGDDVIVGQLLAVVPVVENQVVVTAIGIQEEDLVVDTGNDGVAHAGLARPCAKEFAVTPSIESQSVPARQVVDEDVVL